MPRLQMLADGVNGARRARRPWWSCATTMVRVARLCSVKRLLSWRRRVPLGCQSARGALRSTPPRRGTEWVGLIWAASIDVSNPRSVSAAAGDADGRFAAASSTDAPYMVASDAACPLAPACFRFPARPSEHPQQVHRVVVLCAAAARASSIGSELVGRAPRTGPDTGAGRPPHASRLGAERTLRRGPGRTPAEMRHGAGTCIEPRRRPPGPRTCACPARAQSGAGACLEGS